MADLLKISDATALAMHSLLHLALNPDDRFTTMEIAKKFEASTHHLAKVHQRLTRAGLINSTRGPAGGVSLAKDPTAITLLDIYEIMQGPMPSRPCLFGKEQCPRGHCALNKLLSGITRHAHTYFEQTTLGTLAMESRWGEETK